MPGSRLTPASGATRATAVAVAALLAIAVLALVPGRALRDRAAAAELARRDPGRRRQRPDAVRPESQRPPRDRQHHQADDRADHARARPPPGTDVHPERLRVGHRGLADRAGAGRADERSRPDAGDAAAECRRRRRGSGLQRRPWLGGPVRGDDERQGARARPHPHPLLDADRARHPRQLLERLGPGQAGRLRDRRARRSSGARWRSPARSCTPAGTSARSTTATTSSAAYHWINGVKTGHTNEAGYVLVGSGTSGRDDAGQRRAWDASRSRRATTTRWRCWTTVSITSGCARRCTPDRCWRARRSRAARECTRAVVADLTYSHVFEKGAHVHLIVTAPQQLDGPLRRDAVVGSVAVMDGRKLVRRIPLVLAAAVPAVRSRDKCARLHHATVYACVGRCVDCSRNRVWRSFGAHEVRAKTRRAGMIITVTLNAALDKTLEVPNFTPGRRHRTVDQTTMPGGKGVNVARALKRLGQPVIATGLAGGATGNRIVEALNDEAILNALRPDPRGVADQHGRARPDHRASTPRSTSAGPPCRRRSSSCSATSCSTWPRARASCVFAGSLPRGIEPDVYAGLIREVRRLGVTTIVDTDGEPLRLAVRAEPDVVSPERARGRGARRARVQRRSTTAPRPSSRCAGSGAAEAIMTVADGCYAQVREDGVADAVPRPGRGAGGALERSARATRSWPATSPRATSAARRSNACASASPAAPSRSSTSAPGLLDPSKVDRLLAEVEAERLEIRAEIG